MISIDVDSRIPLEEQIRSEIRHAIAQGVVGEGDPLPSVRQLAGDLGIHWNTVARAYRSLRDEGLLVVGRGRGVHVRETTALTADQDETRRRVDRMIRDALTEARLGGLSIKQMKAILTRELRNFKGSTT